MDFITLLDTWWFRLVTIPIDIVIFYYTYKWVLKKFPSLKESLWYNEEQWEKSEHYEKKIINWFKGLFIKEKKEGLFYN